MSLIDNLTKSRAERGLKPIPGRPPVKPLQADGVKAKLDAAKASLPSIEAEYAAAALASVLAGAGIEEANALEAGTRKLAEQKNLIAMLEAAHVEAVRFDEDQLMRLRLQTQREQIKRVRAGLEARDAAAKDVAAAIEKLCASYRIMIGRSDYARQQCPYWAADMLAPAFTHAGELSIITAAEIWRVADDPDINTGHQFVPPGGTYDDLDRKGFPGRTPKLVDRVTQASRDALARLEAAPVQGAK